MIIYLLGKSRMASEKKFFARIQKFWSPSFGKFNFLILDLVVCIFPKRGGRGPGRISPPPPACNYFWICVNAMYIFPALNFYQTTKSCEEKIPVVALSCDL